MTTIDITRLFDRLSESGEGHRQQYSASVAEAGQTAAQITWDNCLRDGTLLLGDLTDALFGRDLAEAIRNHIRAYGAWPEAVIRFWKPAELYAMLLQEVAAAVGEWDTVTENAPADGEWADYQKRVENGSVTGRLWRAEETGKIYFDLGE